MNVPRIPRNELLDAMAGADVCTTCRGRGSVYVTGPRDKRVCVTCKGTGRTPPSGTTPAYELWMDARSRRKAAREVTR